MGSDIQGAVALQGIDALLVGIDHGIESHLAWNQRLLRCALLGEEPANDLVGADAHRHCQFGMWFTERRKELEAFDETLVTRIAQAHEAMHLAARSICQRVSQGQATVPAELRAYEQGQSAMVAWLNELRERVVAAAAHQDPLTGLPLRHGLEYAFELRRKDARRGHAQLWLAMIDVDRFKTVNDSHGHAVGDRALQHVAHCLGGCLRETDALFRYGGEEFLALFLLPERHDAEALAARVVDAVGAAPLTVTSGATLNLSVTVGMARVREQDDLGAATARADHAMLLGKAQGRGRYVLAPA